MMKNKKLFQTLQLHNVDVVEVNGPFSCHRKDAWLSQGYYFWEHVDLAHTWGIVTYSGNYIIGCLIIEYEEEELLDLVDTNTLNSFEEAYNMLCEKYVNQNITVAFVIEYLRKNTRVSWKAVRSLFDNSFNVKKNPILDKGVPVSNKKQYGQQLNLRPQIQRCILDKSLFEGIPFSIFYINEGISPQMI